MDFCDLCPNADVDKAFWLNFIKCESASSCFVQPILKKLNRAQTSVHNLPLLPPHLRLVYNEKWGEKERENLGQPKIVF